VHGTTFRSRVVAFARALAWPRTRRGRFRVARTALEIRARMPWLGSRSALRRALAGLSADGPVRVHAFVWSGRNRVADRSRAAARLTRKLRLRLKQHPTARHYVVAHSHGGNVALYAMRDPQVGSRLDGLVCLSTPFLHARRRDVRGQYSTLGWVGLLVAGVTAYAVSRFFPQSWSSIRVAGDSLATWAAITAGLVTVAAAALALWLSRRESDRLATEMSIPAQRSTPVLTIRAPADEASMTLAGAEFLLWFINTLWTRVSEMLDRSTMRIYAALDSESRDDSWRTFAASIAIWVLIGSSIALYRMGGVSGDRPITWLLAAPPAVAALAIVLVALVIVGSYLWSPLILLIWALSGLLLWPFGARLFAAAFLEVNVGWSPPGRSEAILLADTAPDAGLAHSASYQDPQALALLVEWIRGTRRT
jgi:hypothetical protein